MNWTGFKTKRINIFGKSVPLWVMLAILAVPVSAATVWVLTQTTTIQLVPYDTPTISADLTLENFTIGEVREQDLAINNNNLVPMVVSSYPTGFKLYIDGDLIAEGYTVEELQDFIHVSNIAVDNADRYGCDDEVCNNAVIPEQGVITYTMAYYVPPTYEVGEDTIYLEGNEVIQLKWQPKVSVWVEGLFDGDEDWENTWHPQWYIDWAG